MTPITVQVPAFSVAGVAVRTCNRDEAQPERARIGALWDQFFTESWARQLPGPEQGGVFAPTVDVQGDDVGLIKQRLQTAQTLGVAQRQLLIQVEEDDLHPQGFGQHR